MNDRYLTRLKFAVSTNASTLAAERLCMHEIPNANYALSLLS